MQVSILFCCYNQQAFVREALQSALAQDFPEYELVVSDDGSDDGTRLIVDEMLASVPAHVRLVRADSLTNQGLVASFNRLVVASSGDILVSMAGDDISERNRLSTLVQVFRDRPAVQLVCSNLRKIDAAGHELPAARFLPDERGEHAYPPDGPCRCLYAKLPMVGATAAYRRTIFKIFGPLGPDAPSEDNCLTTRALLLGPAVYLADRLVSWRRHDGNASTHEFDEANAADARHRHLGEYWRQYRTTLQVEADLRNPGLTGRVEPHLLRAVGACARRHGARQLLRFRSLSPSSWADWSAAVGRLTWRDRLTTTPLMFLRWALPPCRWLYWKLLARKLNRPPR
jgi:glycosyltransferase involved in cell wall biosynthesis